MNKKSWLKEFFIPSYSEFHLFLLAYTGLILFSIDKAMRADVFEFIMGDIRVAVTFLFMIIGASLSLIHAFSTRKKSKLEKMAMLAFAVLTNIAIGVVAGFYILRVGDFSGTLGKYLIIFPILNIVNAIILAILYRINKIDESSISDYNVKKHELVLGAIVTPIMIILLQFYFNTYWAITYSVCMSYVNNFSSVIESFGYKMAINI